MITNNKLCQIVERIETGDKFTFHSATEKFNCTLGGAFDVIMYLTEKKIIEKNENNEYVVVADEDAIIKSACSLGSKVCHHTPEEIVDLATKLTQEDCYILYKVLSVSSDPIRISRGYSNYTPLERMRLNEISADYNLVSYSKEKLIYEAYYRKSFVDNLRFAINEWKAKKREREREKQQLVYECLADISRIKVPVELITAGVDNPKSVTVFNWIKMDENCRDLIERVLTQKSTFKELFEGVELPDHFSLDMIDFRKSKVYYLLNVDEKIKFNVPDNFIIALKAHEKEIVELVNKGRAPIISCKLYLNRKYA